MKFAQALFLGAIMIGVWFGVCGWAEDFQAAAHPGQGAGFFALIALLYGWMIFLIAFPLMYVASREGSDPGPFGATGVIYWVLWFLPIVVYAAIVGVSALSQGDTSETVLTAAMYFPVLGWRVYASLLDLAG